MKKENYHTHSTGSDGDLSPENLIKAAIKDGFSTLAITDHYLLPPGFRKWNYKYTESHYQLLKKLKEKYKRKIKILIGVEFDWLSDYSSWAKREMTKRKYDIRIISIHFLKGKKEYFPLDYNSKTFEILINELGGIKNVVKVYYSSLRDAIKSGYFDVVGHMDLIKIWNKNNKYFSQNEDWYHKEVLKTLKLISKQGMKIDLNSAGWRKPCNEQYPSEWILVEAHKLKIPLLVSTDAHTKNQLSYRLEDLYRLIKTTKMVR